MLGYKYKYRYRYRYIYIHMYVEHKCCPRLGERMRQFWLCVEGGGGVYSEGLTSATEIFTLRWVTLAVVATLWAKLIERNAAPWQNPIWMWFLVLIALFTRLPSAVEFISPPPPPLYCILLNIFFYFPHRFSGETRLSVACIINLFSLLTFSHISFACR